MKSSQKHNFLKYWNEFKRFVHIREDYLVELDKLGRELPIQGRPIPSEKPIKILMGPSFSIFSPCFIHDRILSYALRLRGVTIVPIYCDSIQSTECNVYGGVWKGCSFKECCDDCQEKSEALWQDNPHEALRLSIFLKQKEIEIVNKKIERFGDNWVNYKEGSFAFGAWAKDILVNNYVVGDYHLIPNHNDLGKQHLRNLLLLETAYRNVINTINPDRVISNDSYYGMWAILQKICEQKKIPFYSHWMGGRPHGWCYAYDDAAMNLDFSKPWKSFVKKPLTEKQTQKVKDWLDSRSTGKDMFLDTASLQKFNTEHFDFSKIDVKKPTALLSSNVIWDLAALNKQIVFSDMMDWIVKTIQWFADHPEYQLIIKPHPAELHPSIPKTEERVETALVQRKIEIPANVFLLPPLVKCTVYDLFPLSTIGLVHTTTVGIEMAARGIPVITTAKSPYRGFGFSFDPISVEEYFKTIEQFFSGEIISEKHHYIENAYKFILFYQFHYYTKVDIMDYTLGSSPHLKIQSISDLYPGKNQCRDYIINAMLEGKPIVSENCWPPES